MPTQIRVPPQSLAPASFDGRSWTLLPDVAYKRVGIVNVAFLSSPQGWVLVDAGLSLTAPLIRNAAAARFGDSPPRAILLTHGHFDHVGALKALLREWDVPVYAHPLEMPYLTGQKKYPPADPSSEPGLMARLSPLYSRAPVDVGARARPLPGDGSVPFLPEWTGVHTPGHAPGHVSLWRDSDRTLLAGDAVVTTRQESALAVLRQEPEVHGPPRYFTPDWDSARASVATLAGLEAELLLSGHGRPLRGPLMRAALRELASNFDEVALPDDRKASRHQRGQSHPA
jgi:glyoxylase-like metal-dependent hydrolase (beta-lactamase superfamily II)